MPAACRACRLSANLVGCRLMMTSLRSVATSRSMNARAQDDPAVLRPFLGTDEPAHAELWAKPYLMGLSSRVGEEAARQAARNALTSTRLGSPTRSARPRGLRRHRARELPLIGHPGVCIRRDLAHLTHGSSRNSAFIKRLQCIMSYMHGENFASDWHMNQASNMLSKMRQSQEGGHEHAAPPSQRKSYSESHAGSPLLLFGT